MQKPLSKREAAFSVSTNPRIRCQACVSVLTNSNIRCASMLVIPRLQGFSNMLKNDCVLLKG
ncbi:hypothetical protein FZC70_16480 [Bacillus subtilis]|nr:hypothetical protein FZC70_16480 [Bacillus subtilis]